MLMNRMNDPGIVKNMMPMMTDRMPLTSMIAQAPVNVLKPIPEKHAAMP